MFLWRQSISCPTGGYNRLRRRFRQRLVEVDRTSALVASTICLLHRPYLWMSTMSYWVGLGSSRCWCSSRTDYSTDRCQQKTADKTRSLMSGDSYHHFPTASSVRRTKGGGAVRFHPRKSSHSQQNSEAEEEVASAVFRVTIRARGKTT